MMVNIVKIKDKSRIIIILIILIILITVLKTLLRITGMLRLNSMTPDSERVNLLTHQYLQLRERNIDPKH